MVVCGRQRGPFTGGSHGPDNMEHSRTPEGSVVPVRILLVDDHDVMRGGLRSLLESRPGWEVCGEAANSTDAIEKDKMLRPDVVVMDISMPGFSGLEAVPV